MESTHSRGHPISSENVRILPISTLQIYNPHDHLEPEAVFIVPYEFRRGPNCQDVTEFMPGSAYIVLHNGIFITAVANSEGIFAGGDGMIGSLIKRGNIVSDTDLQNQFEGYSMLSRRLTNKQPFSVVAVDNIGRMNPRDLTRSALGAYKELFLQERTDITALWQKKIERMQKGKGALTNISQGMNRTVYAGTQYTLKLAMQMHKTEGPMPFSFD